MTNTIKHFFNKMAQDWDTHCQPDAKILTDIIDYCLIKEGSDVIDVACGTGVMIEPILSKGAKSIHAIDISPEMIKIARKKYNSPKVTFEVGDFTQTNIKDYDNVIIHNAYPHFLDKLPLINAIYDSLKIGGRFTIAHSIGRERVNGCHKKLDAPISTKLEAAETEAEIFKNQFKIDTIIDTPDMYIISGVKI